MKKFLAFSLTLGNLLGYCLHCQAIPASELLPIKNGINFGISGMALIEKNDDFASFIVVHDNKGDRNQGRFAIINLAENNCPRYTPVTWPNSAELPIDLEAITSIPGEAKSEFMAVTSQGQVDHFQLDAASNKISLIGTFQLPLPAKNTNFEAFALQQLNGSLIAVWAHRGEGDKPAIIYYGFLNLDNYQLTLEGTTELKVPFPTGNVRHISDLKIDAAGVVYLTAATDNGDDGPFQSAVYVAGAFTLQNRQIIFQQNNFLFPIYRLDKHKVEAVELVPGAEGGIILGTDDENLGSFISE